MAKYNEFCALVATECPSIIMLSETWLTSSIPSGMAFLNGYTLFRKDRAERKGGGVCIYILDQILADFVVIPLDVDTGNNRLSFRDPAQLLVNLLNDSRLRQLVTKPTRYRTGQSPSTLDLILSSDNTSLANLDYLPPIGISDHVTLKVDLQICSIPSKKRIDTFKRSITDYKAICRCLNKVDWNNLLSDPSVSNNWNSFKNVINVQIEQHTTTSFVKRSSKKPWINNSILKFIKKKRALWRAFKRTGLEADYKKHRSFSNRLSTIIIEARITYEKSIADGKDTKRLYKHIRTQLSGPVGTNLRIKDDTGTVVDSDIEVADSFAKSFLKIFVQEPPNDIMPSILGVPNAAVIDDVLFSSDAVHASLTQVGERRMANAAERCRTLPNAKADCASLSLVPRSRLHFKPYMGRLRAR
ncbi:uncharacterized protein LOC135135589 [Zophobas morio]|uniref:uncharacterized protein LOC135135589 n=1 Tax=Zophobas morio TaxID=2755281 RepID=UPI0030826D26